ncbi:MAG: alpha-xylosidase [Chloroflexi bacterium]|nr:alpha-xylosidase [Chloroflexota bacterium]
MKFTDGYWGVRADVTAHYPAHVHEVRLGERELMFYGPTVPFVTRFDTVNTPVVTVQLSSPMENVVRVRLYHFKGGVPRTPAFEVHASAEHPVSVAEDDDAATLTTGRLTARVVKQGGWRLEFLDGDREITHSGKNAMGVVDAPEGRYIHEQLALAVGECIYGLGERFTPFVKNGQVVDLWHEDGGTSSEQAYKNVPFYLSNRGYGVFVAHPERVSYEVASEKVERVQFSVPGEVLEYYIIYGPDPKDVVSRYTALTGRPALPPAWSFGLWLTTSFTTDYDEDTVNSFVQGMADRDIPLHVFHFDCFWMKEYHWVDFTWDDRMFPDPAAMLQRLKARGLRICVWLNPYIAQLSTLFDEGMAGGYLVKRPNGDVWQWNKWQAGMGLVDFTNPAACEWYASKLRALIDMGVDCFKTDFGERIPTEVVWHDGSDPQRMHNYYTLLYNRVVFQTLEEKLGRGNAAVFARSATTGGQQYPVHWGGDSTATFPSMAESLRGGLSLSLCGFGFWSHDMGGFEQTASADVYKRWCAFGLLSSHSRLHGSTSYRVPWLFDDEAVDVLRHFTRLKCRLMPYLYQVGVEAHTTGVPSMRAMVLEFCGDPAVDALDRQYMLGPALLVAPVFTADGSVDVYLPAGRWTHLLTGEVAEGGRWQREQHGYMSLPLYVRPNTLLALGANDQQPDYAYADGVTLHLFELGEGATAQAIVPALDGSPALTVQATRSGGQITLRASGNTASWSVLLRGIAAVRAVQGGAASSDPLGTLISAAPNAGEVRIAL